MKSKPSIFLLFFGTFWSAITLLFDGLTVVPAARQVIAMNYRSTHGAIVSSEVTRQDDGEGTTHNLAVRYTYTVVGQEYTGTRYRYGNFNSSDCAWAYAVVATNSPGSRVEVFYNPRNPRDSVLVRGLSGSDLFQFAFMTPFNAVMLGFWWAGWSQFRRNWFTPVAGGVKIIPSLTGTRVQLSEWSAVGTALVTMALLSFLSIFPILFLGGGFHPSMKTMVVAWSVIVCGGVGVGIWHRIDVLRGKYDLVIDDVTGALELPAIEGRKIRRRVLLSDIENIYVEKIQKPSTGDEATAPMYAPTLRLEGAESETQHLVQWLDQEKAERFADWLREKFPRRAAPSRPLAGRF